MHHALTAFSAVAIVLGVNALAFEAALWTFRLAAHAVWSMRSAGARHIPRLRVPLAEAPPAAAVA